jgi:membrane associated rhomboid family serine protease
MRVVKSDKRRHRVLGTLYLSILLLLIFQVQLLVTQWGGYPSVKEMLSSTLGIYTAFFVGPFLHNTALHLVENLTVLVLAAGYLEYTSQPARRIYAVYIIAGWFGLLAAIMINEPVVGASASVAGLTACASIVPSYYFYQAVQSAMAGRKPLLVPLFTLLMHTAFWYFFLVKTITHIDRLTVQNGTNVSHGVGAAVGLIFGISLLRAVWENEENKRVS